MTHVLFTFDPEPHLREHLAEELGHECRLLFPEGEEDEFLYRNIGSAEVVVGWRADESLLQNACRVRLWQNPGVGVTHLLPLFRSRPHITLANSHGNTYFTAQHAVALLLTLLNRTHLHHQWMRSGHWRTGEAEAASVPLRNCVVGVLGYGHVGRKVARFLTGFDIQLTAYRNRPAPEDDHVPEVTVLYAQHGCSLSGFARDCDILVVTLPLTEQTEGMIDADALADLGPNGFLVNVGRGGVIVEADLYHALRDGVIGGAALDVWWREHDPQERADGGQRPYDYPFEELRNVVMSPHRAASPFDSLDRWNDVIENIRRAARGRDDFLNIVDTERGY